MYKEVNESDIEESDADGDSEKEDRKGVGSSSDEDPPPVKKNTRKASIGRNAKKASPLVSTTKTAREKRSKKPVATKKIKEFDIKESDSEKEDTISVNSGDAAPPAKKNTRTVSRGRKAKRASPPVSATKSARGRRSKKPVATKTTNESDIEHSNADDDSEKEDTNSVISIEEDRPSVEQNNRKASSGKNAKKASPSESTTTARGRRSKSVAAKTTPGSKRKAGQSRSRSTSATRGKKQRNAPETEKPVVSESASKNSDKKKDLKVKSPSPFLSPKSPFRRRHKNTSPSKKARSKVLDLTQDDEFAFG